MKQRIRTVGIIRDQEGVLVLKRARRRSEELPVWELLTGKIEFGEQPEEAMGRAVDEYLGVKVRSMRLKDVVTFVSLEGSSQSGNLYIIYEIILEAGQKIRPRDRYSAYRYIKEEAGVRLDEASITVLEIDGRNGRETNYREVANAATVYVDGASRGNPGPAGIGYYIVGENGEVLRRGGEFIGFATSRIAEYYALKEGCEQAIELGLKTVRFVCDNLMMVNQMNGIYRLKNRDLVPIYNDIQVLLLKFEACAFIHVKREMNVEADREANKAIDAAFLKDKTGIYEEGVVE